MVFNSSSDDEVFELARLRRREVFQQLQVRLVSERLEPMLEGLGEAMAAKRRMDAHPADAPDIRDVDVLISYAEREWPPLSKLLGRIPRAEWPRRVPQVEAAVAGINQTLRRPFDPAL
jgi:hypothetical protein